MPKVGPLKMMKLEEKKAFAKNVEKLKILQNCLAQNVEIPLYLVRILKKILIEEGIVFVVNVGKSIEIIKRLLTNQILTLNMKMINRAM